MLCLAQPAKQPFPVVETGIPELRAALAAGKPPDALFLNVIWPCGEPGQIETPESLLTALAPIARTGRIPILGIGTCPDPAYLRALAVLS